MLNFGLYPLARSLTKKNQTWTPLALQPLLWLKADELPGQNGDPIDMWQDASGNSNHMFGGVFQVVVEVTRKYALFDGSTYFNGAAAVGDLTGEFSVFVVEKGFGAVCGSFDISLNIGFYLAQSDDTLFTVFADAANIGCTTTKNYTDLKAIGFVRDGTQTRGYEDGNVVGVGPRGVITSTAYDFYVGDSTDGYAGFTGQIAELIVIPRALTSGEVAQLQAWFEARWPLANM